MDLFIPDGLHRNEGGGFPGRVNGGHQTDQNRRRADQNEIERLHFNRQLVDEINKYGEQMQKTEKELQKLIEKSQSEE